MAQELTSSNLCHRLLKEGASKLSDSELVAILLETTPSGEEMMTLHLARQLLKYDGELCLFLGLVRDWLWYTQESLKPNEAFLKASFEVQRRALIKVLKNCNAILYPDLTRHFLMSELSGRAGSVLSGLFLNQQHRMLGFEDLFCGSYDDTNIYHRDTILKEVKRNIKRYSATEFLMVRSHNFSVDATPTPADISLTRWLMRRLRFTGVLLLDYRSEGSSISSAKQWLI